MSSEEDVSEQERSDDERSDDERSEEEHSEEERSEDEEDEDNDDEENDAEVKKRKSSDDSSGKKKRKKPRVSQFIDDIADVDDGDDEEDEHGYYEEVDESREAEEAEELEKSHYRYNQERMNYETESAEDIVNRIKRKHQRSRTRFDEEDIEGEFVQSEVTQQSLLPSVADPKLWVLKCKPGREQHLVLAMMNKFLDMSRKGTPLHIKSVIASSTKGFVYIEAERESHAKDAVSGIRDMQPWTMKLVPIHEMTSVLTIQSRKKPIVAGSWARIKRAGLYKGDLCKVLEVLDSGARAFIKLIPRLDPSGLGGMSTKDKNQRPPPKLFVPETAVGEVSRKRHPLTGEMYDFYENDWFHDGFLHKEVNINTMLQTEDVTPTLDEIRKFSHGTDRDDDGNQHIAIDNQEGGDTWKKDVALAKGDTVRVIEGDLINLMGIVVSTAGGSGTVKVRPLHEEIKDTILDFQLNQLMKFVKVGDHVKVVSGRYSGETGTVVSVDESEGAPVAIVLSDSMAKEIQVRVRDIQESAEISTGLDSLKGKELYQFVMLGHTEVAVITHIGRDEFEVLTNTGQTRQISDQEIQRVLDSSKAQALDKKHNYLTPGEMVSVVDGPHQGQTGTIKHLYRTYVFLHSNRHAKNSGIFVVRARQVVLAGSKARSNKIQRSQVGPPTRGGRQGGRGRRNDDRGGDMVGKSVKIRKGQFKGYLGIVVEETEQKAKVEIHSKNKVLEIDKQYIIVAGDRKGHIQHNPRTSQTPMVGQTPMQSQTPLHSGGRTPMHTPLGSTTPTPHTPSGGDAWNPTSTMEQEQDMPYGSSYGTPLEPVTPAAQTTEAATPGAFYQPTTPGGVLPYSPAPDAGGPVTPGIFQPTTPAAPFGTPVAQTPGAYPPQTPNTPSGLGGMTPAPMTPGFVPSTPSIHSDSSSSWVTPDIDVRITRGDLDGSIGVIKQVHPGGLCTVAVGDQMTQISSEGMTPVVPEKHNRVKVISGSEAGQIGSLIGTDGGDGIVKMIETHEIKILVLSTLARMSG